MNLQQKLENLIPRIKKTRITLTFLDGSTLEGWKILIGGEAIPWAVYKEPGASWWSFYLLGPTACGLQDQRIYIKNAKQAAAFAAYLCEGVDWGSYEIVTEINSAGAEIKKVALAEIDKPLVNLKLCEARELFSHVY